MHEHWKPAVALTKYLSKLIALEKVTISFKHCKLRRSVKQNSATKILLLLLMPETLVYSRSLISLPPTFAVNLFYLLFV